MSRVPGGGELRTRIQEVFMATERTRRPSGALEWFAERAKVHPQTVSRWVNNHSPISGPALALLETLESAVEEPTEA